MSTKLFPEANGIRRPAHNAGYPKKYITEMNSNGFFSVDNNLKVKYWNKGAEKIIGITASDMVGKDPWQAFPSALPSEFYSLYHNMTRSDRPVHREEYLGQIGGWFDVIIYYFDDGISISFKSNSHPPIPEYPDHPEQKLRLLNELYRFVTTVMNDCLWEWNLQDQQFFWIDGGHKRMFGYQIMDAFVPQNFWESLIHPDDKIRVLEKLREMVAGESNDTWEIEYRFKKADGEYAYVFDRGRILYDDDDRGSRMIGATRDITSKFFLEKELTRERLEKQQEITEAVLNAHENERKEIGKEMHDNLNQILGAAKLYIEVAKTDDENREMCLEKASEYVTKVIEEIRRVSKTLITPDMNFLGLVESIRNLVDDTVLSHSIKLSFRQNGIVDKLLSEKLQVDIFRIIQEQLNNILKHSQATSASIELSRQGNQIMLLIKDNGTGSDESTQMGVGLINIKSRAELNHGSLTILSKPGKGYSLQVVLNITGRK